MTNVDLEQVIRGLFDRKIPPDEISLEWNANNKPYIRLAWDNGLERHYEHDRQMYNRAFDLFNRLWKQQEPQP